MRLYFTAGEAAQKEKRGKEQILNEAARLLNVEKDQLPFAVNNLFQIWKMYKKLDENLKKHKDIGPINTVKANEESLNKTKLQKYQGDILSKTADILRTQPEHVVKTIKRFLSELEEMKGKIK